jgi:hypothetical protein
VLAKLLYINRDLFDQVTEVAVTVVEGNPVVTVVDPVDMAVEGNPEAMAVEDKVTASNVSHYANAVV